MYVWIDALNNYVTATGVLNGDGRGPRAGYWPCDVHVIGKDILRFHAVYWPAFLMSAGLPLPKRVFAHGFLYNRGEKMSKSVGNVIDPFALVSAFGRDAVRYFFLRETAFGQDGSYSDDAIIGRMNADLANNLGNLAQRSLSMIAKNFGGVVPSPEAFTDADTAMLAAVDALYPAARAAMNEQAIKVWLDAVWTVLIEANQYFDKERPFDKTLTEGRRGTILYVTAEIVRQVGILVQPAMPESATKLLDLLELPAGERMFAHLGAGHRIRPGTTLPAPSGVFPRWIDPEEAARRAGQAKPGKKG
jgi:methionyl-tRNA synthetase